MKEDTKKFTICNLYIKYFVKTNTKSRLMLVFFRDIQHITVLRDSFVVIRVSN